MAESVIYQASEDATAERRGLQAEKAQLRAAMRARSRTLTEEKRLQAGAVFAEKMSDLAAYSKARSVMAFVGMPGEPDTRPLLERILADGKTLLLPRCPDAERMEACRVQALRELIPGRMNIPEPPPDAKPERPDLVLLPCMAATPDGRRLGHGAGYYDRFLAKREYHSAVRVILCMRLFLLDDLPVGPLDVRADQVLTDESNRDGKPEVSDHRQGRIEH